MSFAQRGADFLENLNPFEVLKRREEQRKQERQREERERQLREQREQDAFNYRLAQQRLESESRRAAEQAQQTLQLTQAGANSELGRQLTRDNNNTTNATRVIGVATDNAIRKTGAEYEGQIGLTRADYEGKNSVITNLLRGQKDSQASKQDFAKETLAGYQAHERAVLNQLVGATPALEQVNSTYLAGLDRTIAADERLQAAERPLRWAGLVLPTTAALAAALIK